MWGCDEEEKNVLFSPALLKLRAGRKIESNESVLSIARQLNDDISLRLLLEYSATATDPDRLDAAQIRSELAKLEKVFGIVKMLSRADATTVLGNCRNRRRFEASNKRTDCDSTDQE